VHQNLFYTSFLRRRRQGEEMLIMTVHTAVGDQPDEVQPSTPRLRKSFRQNAVLLQFPLGDCLVDPGQVLVNDPARAQVEMADLIRAYLERIDRDAKGLPIKLYPFMRTQPARDQPRTVVIDPRVAFGKPVIAGTGIPTAVLAEQFKAGDPVPLLAKEYGAQEEAVWDAIRCELELEAA
jgi:uncharacterized protein (DUF433 family)